MTPPKFTIRRRGKVPVIEFPESLGIGGTVRILVQYCEHFDSIRSEVDLIRQHMQEAKDEGAPIIKIGDTFDACNGKWDPRRSTEGLREEFRGRPDYLDRLVDEYARFAEPFAPNIALMCRGNHEQEILERCECDLIARTADRLRQAGSPVIAEGVGGYLLVNLHISKTSKKTVPIYYHHGSRGVMGKGIGGTARRSAALPDAAVVLTGGSHHEWTETIARYRVNIPSGRLYQDEQLSINVGSYLRSHAPEGASPSWHARQGHPPKTLGATWVELTMAKEFDNTFQATGKPGARLPLWKVVANARRAK